MVVAAAPAASAHECDAHDPDLAFTPAGDDVESNGYRATIVPAARALARHLGETVHVAARWRDSVISVASVVPVSGVAAPWAPVAAELTPLGQVLQTARPGLVVGPSARSLA